MGLPYEHYIKLHYPQTLGEKTLQQIIRSVVTSIVTWWCYAMRMCRYTCAVSFWSSKVKHKRWCNLPSLDSSRNLLEHSIQSFSHICWYKASAVPRRQITRTARLKCLQKRGNSMSRCQAEYDRLRLGVMATPKRGHTTLRGDYIVLLLVGDGSILTNQFIRDNNQLIDLNSIVMDVFLPLFSSFVGGYFDWYWHSYTCANKPYGKETIPTEYCFNAVLNHIKLWFKPWFIPSTIQF